MATHPDQGPKAQRFCAECGAELKGARFCPECGTRVRDAVPAAGRPEAQQPSVTSRSKRPWLVAAAAAAAAVVVLAVVLIGRLGAAGPSHAQRARHTPAIAASTRAALVQFSNQVQPLLTQSAPAYQQINRLFQQMQVAASGGTPDITLAQAESMISSVVSNRTAIAASVRTISAPTPLAASVRAALAASMDASLTDDQAISTCLNQANTGTVAYIFQSCLTSTSADNQAASAAKQHFLTLYNQLRSQIGQPPVSAQF